MKSRYSARSRLLFTTALVMLIAVAAVVTTISLIDVQPIWGYMRNYDEYVSCHATETQVIAQEGKPVAAVRSDAELGHWLQRFRPMRRLDTRVRGTVFIYYADPEYDGEGHVVYIFFDDHGVAYQTTFAS